MELLVFPTLVAIFAQFAISPMLFGALKPAEILSWGIVMGVSQGIPSVIIYLTMFAIFGVTAPSDTVAVLLAIAFPVVAMIGYLAITEQFLDFRPLKPILTMGLIGSLSGTFFYLTLR